MVLIIYFSWWPYVFLSALATTLNITKSFLSPNTPFKKYYTSTSIDKVYSYIYQKKYLFQLFRHLIHLETSFLVLLLKKRADGFVHLKNILPLLNKNLFVTSEMLQEITKTHISPFQQLIVRMLSDFRY